MVNTSFNIRGEPIVCTIEDAFNCFMGTDLDILVCENFILYKDKQDKKLIRNYKDKVELDWFHMKKFSFIILTLIIFIISELIFTTFFYIKTEYSGPLLGLHGKQKYSRGYYIRKCKN